MKMWQWFFKKSINFPVLLTQFCDKNLMNENVSILWGKCISDVYFFSGPITALPRYRSTAPMRPVLLRPHISSLMVLGILGPPLQRIVGKWPHRTVLNRNNCWPCMHKIFFPLPSIFLSCEESAFFGLDFGGFSHWVICVK